MSGFNGEADGGKEWSNLYAASQGVWSNFLYSSVFLVLLIAFQVLFM